MINKKKEFTIKSEETKILAALIVGFLGILFLLSLFVEGSIFGYITTIFGLGTVPAGITFLLI